MSSPIPKFIEIQIRVHANNPVLLEGLEAWVRLGLLSDEQVLRLSQQYLSQPRPLTAETAIEQPILNLEDHLTVEPSVSVPQPQRNLSFSSFPTQLFQSLKAEFSVRWLLFLGLFMVLVSSGVLVASRWQQLPLLAQYGVLFAYTLGFFGSTIWLSLNRRLPLTSETLKWVTLLLIPLNFWAIDGLGLFYSNTFIISAIAIIILTGITIFLNPIRLERESPETLQQAFLTLNLIGLSYLQLGWRLPNFSFVALYIGLIITGIITFYGQKNYQQIPLDTRQHLPFIFALVPVTFLWWRALSISNVLTEYGLALGLTGGLLYLYPFVFLKRFAYVFLIVGWFFSVDSQPGQALGVSLIAFVIFGSHLIQFWRKRDFAFIFAIGLQSWLLVWRLIPVELQQQIIEIAQQIPQDPNKVWTLLALVGLVYLVLVLILINKIYQLQHPQIAQFGEQITVGFAAILTGIAFFDPVVQFLHFLAATLILLTYTIRRQPLRVVLVYLTHITGLLTLASLIQLSFPQLRLEQWGVLSIVFMLGEWLFHTVFTRQHHFNIHHSILKSSWHIGLSLAGFSYQFFYKSSLNDFDFICLNFACQGRSLWGIFWLTTPIALTTIAAIIPTRQELASQLSIMGVVLLQILVFRIPEIRLISWGVGTGLLILNTNSLQSQISALLTVGFGLTFSGFLAVEKIPNFSLEAGVILVAVALNFLWISQIIFNRISNFITHLYAVAVNSWASLLSGIQVIILTLYTLGIYWQLLTPSIQITVATFISTIAVLIRLLNPPPSEQTEHLNFPFLVYIWGWLLELLMANLFSFTENSFFNLSIANLMLGLTTQIIGDYWQRRNQINQLSNPWQILPLFYGMFGAVLRTSGRFDNWTGISVLILALIFIGIGRRSPQFKPLTYLGIAGVSVAAYQMLFYNLSPASIGEQFIAFAGLGTTIVYVYRLLSPLLSRYLDLSQNEIKIIAHIHWAMSSCFLITSLTLPSEFNSWLSLGIGSFLTRYAIFQGRNNSNSIEAEFWVYIGCSQALIILYFVSDLLNLESLLIQWGGTLASILAYFLYFIPWESWGWPIKPWRRVAVLLPALTLVITAIILGSTLELSWYFSVILAILLYGVLARYINKIQLTYFSVFILNFAYYRWLFFTENNLNALGDVILPGLSILYIAQVDPILQRSEYKLARHWTRIFGIGMICFAALLSSQWIGIVPGFISLFAIFIGLGLRIRAFLYVGTVTFLINAINQILILNAIYSFLKWIIGFIIGLLLIWIAANFENRREQMMSTVQNWVIELEEWD